MGVPTSEVGYTPAMPRREDHEVHKGHVVALDQKKFIVPKVKPMLFDFMVWSTPLGCMGCHRTPVSVCSTLLYYMTCSKLSQNDSCRMIEIGYKCRDVTEIKIKLRTFAALWFTRAKFLSVVCFRSVGDFIIKIRRPQMWYWPRENLILHTVESVYAVHSVQVLVTVG